MEIYLKDKDGKLQQTTLMQLIEKASAPRLNVETGGWEDENFKWLGIVQNKSDKQITININFENCENKIIGANVYSTPIKRVIDEENTKQII